MGHSQKKKSLTQQQKKNIRQWQCFPVTYYKPEHALVRNTSSYRVIATSQMKCQFLNKTSITVTGNKMCQMSCVTGFMEYNGFTQLYLIPKVITQLLFLDIRSVRFIQTRVQKEVEIKGEKSCMCKKYSYNHLLF